MGNVIKQVITYNYRVRRYCGLTCIVKKKKKNVALRGVFVYFSELCLIRTI